MNQKFFSFLIIFSLIFGACSDDKEDEKNNETTIGPGEILYETDEYSFIRPQTWEIIEKDQFPPETPGSIILVVRNNLRSEVFTANLNILKSEFEGGITSEILYEQALKRSKNNLIEFKATGKEEKTINAGGKAQKAIIYNFQGKFVATSPVTHFKQLIIGYNNSGYVLTGTYLLNEDAATIEKIDTMINTFNLK